jgi:hypothetical protein
MNKLFKFSAIKFFLMGLILFNAHNSFAHGATEKVEISCGLQNVIYNATSSAPTQYVQWVTYGIPISLIEKHFVGKQGEFTIPLEVEIDADDKIWKKSGSAAIRIEGDQIQVLNSRHPYSFPIFLENNWIKPITIDYWDEESYRKSFNYNIRTCKIIL